MAMQFEDRKLRIDRWNETLAEVRTFFVERGFVEVPFVPMVTTNPGMEPNLDPLEVDLRLANPARNLKVGLITSPEYAMKKLLGSGMQKIFTITPVFRGLEAVNATNLPQFMMLEWYGPGDYEDLMQETEDLLNSVAGIQEDWDRIPYAQAEMEDEEPHVQADYFFVTDYPTEQASLAKIGENGKAERFEAFYKDLELCNGFVELTNAEEQRKRFEKEQEERRLAGKTVFPVDGSLLAALQGIEGSVYGNALGLDRLLMLKYGISDIRQIQLFQAEEYLQE